jgi:hypothetical protein
MGILRYICFMQNVNKTVQEMCTLPHNVERWSHELMISSISDVNSFNIFLSSLPLLSMSTAFPLLLTLSGLDFCGRLDIGGLAFGCVLGGDQVVELIE